MQDLTLCLQPIGIIESPYQQKFSVPRQPDLVPDGTAILELLPPYNQPETVRGLEQFSHLWLIFQFNHIETGKWQPTVRPPRLGGNQRIGVFASRATHRPNPLGLSKVALQKVEISKGKVRLHLGSVDLVNGTPIFDIKPYIAYADSEPNAISGFADQKPSTRLQVLFSQQAEQKLKNLAEIYPHFRRFIADLLAQDPRPAYQQNQYSERIYGMSLYQYNVRWRVIEIGLAEVLDIEKVG